MRKTISILAVILLVVTLTSCGETQRTYTYQPKNEITFTTYKNGETFASDQIVEGYELAAENNVLKLFYQKQDGNIAVLDKRTGNVIKNIPDGVDDDTIAIADAKNALKSAVTITYLDSQMQKVIDSYTMCVQTQRVTTQVENDVLTVTYDFTDGKLSEEDIPKKLSKERFEYFFVNHPDLKENDKTRTSKYYDYDEKAKVYVWSEDNRDSAVGFMSDILNRVGYTRAELEKDNKENGIETLPSNRMFFKVRVNYFLDGESLISEVPLQELEYNSNKPPLTLTLNPYLMSSKAKDGSMITPKASGGLIHFSKSKTDVGSCYTPLYTTDYMSIDGKQSDDSPEGNMPIFGMYQGDNGILGIIEDGDTFAKICAQKAGTLTEYNHIYPEFNVLNVNQFVLGDGSMTSNVMVVQDCMYQGDLRIRYSFLNEPDISYVDLAHYYRAYVMETRNLEQLKTSADIPLNLEFIGVIEKIKSFLGFTYEGQIALTDLDEIKSRLTQLESDVGNINIKLNGVLQDGLDNESITQPKLSRTFGKESEILEFLQQDNVYLGLDVLSVPKDAKKFSRYQDTAKKIDKSIGKKYQKSLVDNDDESYRYILNPLFAQEKLLQVVEQMSPKGLAPNDLGREIYADYEKNNPLTRQDVKQITENMLNEAGDISWMLNNPADFALKQAKTILNVTTDGQNKMVDENIPFYQIVYHGLVVYSDCPVNESNDRQKMLLKQLETGSVPYFRLFDSEPEDVNNSDFLYLYSNSYRVFEDEMIQMYQAVNQMMKDLQTESITNHRKVAEGIYETTYGNKAKITVNYNTGTYERSELQ